MEEIWKSVKEYEDYYQISNFGNMRSIERTIITKNNVHRKLKSKQLKLHLNEFGYVITMGSINNVQKNFKIHRVVAEAFILNPENKLTVNHKDTNKQNNHISNLEWSTHSENIKHAYIHYLNNSVSQYKSVSQYTKDNEFITQYKSISAAKKALKIKGGHISDVCNGRMKTAYGYVWKFN